MKRKAFTMVEAIVVIVILAIIAAILFPVFARQRENVHRPSCMSNLKQMSLGMMQYTKDYDEKFPPAKNNAGGWADLVFPYIKSNAVFRCPANERDFDHISDYFFNSRLSSVLSTKIPAPNLTISMGDGLPDQPLDANLAQLPAAWIRDSNSPANRHLDGANYAFVDGHVKWFKPEKITLGKPALGKPTFLLGKN